MITFNGNTIKNIAIVVLSLGLIGVYIFTSSDVDADMYKEQIEKLEESNEQLLFENDSIAGVNKKIDKEIKDIRYSIYLTKNKLTSANNKIKTLENEKDKIIPYVDDLDADDVAREFTEYLKRRESKNKGGN